MPRSAGIWGDKELTTCAESTSLRTESENLSITPWNVPICRALIQFLWFILTSQVHYPAHYWNLCVSVYLFITYFFRWIKPIPGKIIHDVSVLDRKFDLYCTLTETTLPLKPVIHSGFFIQYFKLTTKLISSLSLTHHRR